MKRIRQEENALQLFITIEVDSSTKLIGGIVIPLDDDPLFKNSIKTVPMSCPKTKSIQVRRTDIIQTKNEFPFPSKSIIELM